MIVSLDGSHETGIRTIENSGGWSAEGMPECGAAVKPKPRVSHDGVRRKHGSWPANASFRLTRRTYERRIASAKTLTPESHNVNRAPWDPSVPPSGRGESTSASCPPGALTRRYI